MASDKPRTRIHFKGPGLPSRDNEDNLDIVSIERPGFSKHYITAHPDETGSPESMFSNLSKCIKKHDASIISQFVFGGTELHGNGMAALEDSCGTVEWPVTWIQGDGASGTLLTGTQAYALSGRDSEMLVMDGQIVGNMYEDEHAKYCLLGDLMPNDITVSRRDQTRMAFEKMERALKRIDMDFSHVIRTWLYLDNLLEWYDGFNAVRNEFFTDRGVFDNLVPASTGIGVSNPMGAALVTDLLAVKPKNDKVKISAVPSPLQCPALDYKSSFSRAVELELPDHRQLFISGTASIEPGGETAYVGDTEGQIDLTMTVVKAILESRGMSWRNTTRSIAYFKNVEEVPLFYKYCEDKKLPAMPIAIAHSDVCRDNLLFEIEFDASVPV